METYTYYKYSPLWYATMSMKAFANGDYRLAEVYYTHGQEILKITGSVHLPFAHHKLEAPGHLSISDTLKEELPDYELDSK